MKYFVLTITLSLLILAATYAQPSNIYEVYAIEYGGSDARVPASRVAIGGNPCQQSQPYHPRARPAGNVKVP